MLLYFRMIKWTLSECQYTIIGLGTVFYGTVLPYKHISNYLSSAGKYKEIHFLKRNFTFPL